MIKLAHFNVGTTNLVASVHFYETVVGLTQGHRPDFASTGAWMYSGDEPLVHLVELNRVLQGPDGFLTGAIDHVALEATGLSQFKTKLQNLGVAFTEQPIPDDEGWQVFVVDPSGVKLEFNFLGEFAHN